ncbi:MAG: hypothetical protein Q7S29_05605 [Candidatus Peribacter sp.]|nr:hypothetical protein [Candidatus Peribacter sp.]
MKAAKQIDETSRVIGIIALLVSIFSVVINYDTSQITKADFEMKKANIVLNDYDISFDNNSSTFLCNFEFKNEGQRSASNLTIKFLVRDTNPINKVTPDLPTSSFNELSAGKTLPLGLFNVLWTYKKQYPDYIIFSINFTDPLTGKQYNSLIGKKLVLNCDQKYRLFEPFDENDIKFLNQLKFAQPQIKFPQFKK